MAYDIGQGGNLLIGSNVCPVEQWEISGENGTQDITTTASANETERLAGVNDATLTGKAFFNVTTPQNAAPLNIKPGTSLTFVSNIGGSAKTFTFPGIVKNTKVTNPAKGVIPFEFTVEQRSGITYPA